MNIYTVKLPRNCNIFLFGDDHEGSLLRYSDGWGKLVDMLNSEYDGISENFGIDHGDIIEAIMVDDKRYDGLTTDGIVLQQIQKAIKNRVAIKDKLIAMMDGNHPRKLWRFGRITEHICNELGVRYGDWSSVFRYENGKPMFSHYAAHGFASINSRVDDPKDRKNSMCRSLKRIMQNKVGDCVLQSMGHVHRLLVYNPEPELYLSTSNGQEHAYTEADQTAGWIPPTQRWYVATGSFYKTLGDGYAGYAEIKGYDPLQLGFAVAVVRDGKLQRVDEVKL